MYSHEPKRTNFQPFQICVLDLDLFPVLPPDDDGLLLLGFIGKSDTGVTFHRNGDSLVSPGCRPLSTVNK